MSSLGLVTLTLFLAAWSVFVAGCASGTPAPTDQWAAAQAAIARAEVVGAPAVPNATLHLRLAQENLEACRRLMSRDNELAATRCALSTTEADLARSLADQASAQSRALVAEGDLQRAREGAGSR